MSFGLGILNTPTSATYAPLRNEEDHGHARSPSYGMGMPSRPSIELFSSSTLRDDIFKEKQGQLSDDGDEGLDTPLIASATRQGRFVEDGAEEKNEDADDEDRYTELPKAVREVVDMDDDPNEPTMTFRYFILSSFFVIMGAFLSQMGWFRTTHAPFSTFIVAIASHYFGRWWEQLLPDWSLRVGPWTLSLNPGPFGMKEHVLIVLTAGAGAHSNMGEILVSVKEIFYEESMNPMYAILFMWASMWTGFSYAAFARNFLVYNPEIPWPTALQQVAVFKALRGSRAKMQLPKTPTVVSAPVSRHHTPVTARFRGNTPGRAKFTVGTPSPAASPITAASPSPSPPPGFFQQREAAKLRSIQMKVFWVVFLAIFVWQFLPEFAFPMLSSLALFCWFAPRSAAVKFIGSGIGGMGFLNFTLDWSNVTSLVITQPWYVQVIIFIAFMINCWVLIPIAKFGHMWGGDTFDVMSNKLFTENGTHYPFHKIMTPTAEFNATAFEEIGMVRAGPQYMWGLFFQYASYTSALVWLGLFHGDDVWKVLKGQFGGGKKIVYNDKLNWIMKTYKEVPLKWYIILFVISFTINFLLVLKGELYLPWWTYIIALIIGATFLLPMGFVYAVSGFGVHVGILNELIFGYMAPSKHPLASLVYRTVSGQCWYRAATILEDQKIGHYLHIPPRDVFFSQIWGSIIGIPVNYITIRWILDTKMDYLTGKEKDPLNQWTGQTPNAYNSAAVQYGLVGPARLFRHPAYAPLPLGFILGAAAPFLVFYLHKRFPKRKFHLWNSTILFSSMGHFRGYISTGPLTSIILGFIARFWLFRFHHDDIWKPFAYMFGAASDAGFNLNMLFMFLLTSVFHKFKMPHWWGNDASSIERCFVN
ncbi:OPT superfamily oligopeptide transporter [Calocera cornea HHB12733]|uniref:OPT superfamily oligopeptide transporter n=1 Tax=Calocera cornea HHB12733 TaxID=1353952 RepID=A0A165K1D2_9BASI|nr:OPT superfamily oligopeptide transporter [Calocera cornea HHB12733]